MEHGHTPIPWVGFKPAARCSIALGLRAVIQIGFKHKDTARKICWSARILASVQNFWQKPQSLNKLCLPRKIFKLNTSSRLWVGYDIKLHASQASRVGPKPTVDGTTKGEKITRTDGKTSTLQSTHWTIIPDTTIKDSHNCCSVTLNNTLVTTSWSLHAQTYPAYFATHLNTALLSQRNNHTRNAEQMIAYETPRVCWATCKIIQV